MTTMGLAPSTHVAGGLIDDVDINIPQPVLAICMTMDCEGEEHAQYYSVGPLENWVPSKDGKTAEKVGKSGGMSKSSNGSQLIASIVNAGFPEDKLKDDLSIFDGLKGHVNRVAQPKRTGLAQKKKEDGREATILLFTSITEIPGGKKVKGKAKASTKKAEAEPAEVDEDIDNSTTMAILEAVSEGPVPRGTISKAVFKIAMKDPNRNKIVARAYDDAFLKGLAEEGIIDYDGTTISPK
jgi:hypothetical protein